MKFRRQSRQIRGIAPSNCSGLFLACLAAATTTCVALPALANGRFPATNQFVSMPGKTSELLVRSTFGYLLSTDTGQNWYWICEQSSLGPHGAAGTEDPGIALTASGAIIVAASEGLAVSPDTGCSWHAGTDGTTILGGPMPWGGSNLEYFVDVAVRPNAPHEAVAIQSAYDSESGAQTFLTQVYETTDDGAHWTVAGVPINTYFIADTIEVAASDPNRLYVTGQNDTPSADPSRASLFESTDNGATWIEHPIPLLAGEEAAFIGAVDPTNPDRVYMRTGDSALLQPSRLLVTDDGGKTFSVKYVGDAPMQGFALTPDGKTVYIGFSQPLVDGGAPDGLLMASTSDFSFSQRANIFVQCLGLVGSTLYACAPEVNGFIVGASTDQGMTFKTLLHLCSVRGPLACGANTPSGMQCPTAWDGGTAAIPVGQGAQLGVPCPPDAGAPDAGPPPAVDGGTPPVKTPASTASPGCGCSAPGLKAGVYGFGGLALGWAAFALRRSRRRRA